MATGPLGPETVVKLAYLAAARIISCDAARDVAQETWIKYQAQALKSGPQWPERMARSWTRCVASNAAKTLLRNRKGKAEPGLEGERHPDGSASDPAEEVASAEQTEIYTELAWRVLGELSPRRRHLITLRDLEGKSWDEISQVLEEKPSTLRSRYCRLKEDLQRRIKRLGARTAGCAAGKESGHV